MSPMILPQNSADKVLHNDLEVANCRLWEIEHDPNTQITKVKERLRDNVFYW